MKTIIIVALLTFYFGVNASWSQINSDSTQLTKKQIMEMSQDELVNMPLEDLMKLADIVGVSVNELLDMVVSTASKKDELIEEAPAIIDVITKEQIKDFSANNLYELLSYLPGIEYVENFFGRSVLNFRGVQNINYTNKTLLMINGNPFYEVVTGANFLESIPINSIEQIEVIRGPGSPLFGTNAYSGVVNIITKTNHSTGLSAKAAYGSFNRKIASTTASINNQKGFSSFIAAEYDHSDGYNFNVTADEKGNSKDIDYKRNATRIYGNIIYKNLIIEGGYSQLENSMYGITPNISYTGIQDIRQYYVNAKFQKKITEKIASTSYVRYSDFNSPSISIGYFPYPGFPYFKPGEVTVDHDSASAVHLEQGGRFFSIEQQFNTKITQNICNVTGIVYENNKTEPYYFIYDKTGEKHPFSAYTSSFSSYNAGIYTQFNLNLLDDRLNIVAGGRVMKDVDLENSIVSPRAGVIFKINNNHFVKGLYGEAFRSASFFEKYVSTQTVLWGNTSLKPERIRTIDLSFEGRIGNHLKYKVNGFYMNTYDGISRLPSDDTSKIGEMYFNTIKQEFLGTEISLNAYLTKKIYGGINFSYKNGKQKNDNETVDVLGIAPYHGNCWFTYKYKSFYISPSIQYIAPRQGYSTRQITNETNQVVDYGSYQTDAIFLINTTTGFKIKAFDLSFSIKNILDQDYVYPEYIRKKSEFLPGGPRLNFMFSLLYEWNYDKE